MSKPWIDALAEETKQGGREAAEAYGREQHRAGIVDEQGKPFFTALVFALEQDFAEMRSRLQGSAVACETAVHRISATEVHLARARFPWFEAALRHDGDTVALDYTGGRGVTETNAASVERHSARFMFQVDGQDKLSIAESFAEKPLSFHEPDELSKHITGLLFKN